MTEPPTRFERRPSAMLRPEPEGERCYGGHPGSVLRHHASMTPEGNEDMDALTEAVFATIDGTPQPFLHDLMGLRAVARDEDSVTISMELSDGVRGFGEGSIHGGMLATFADVASVLTLTYDGDSEIPVTTDLHVRYYRQPRSGPLTAEARVVHRGRRLLGTECVITDGEQRVLARTTATYMLVPY